MNESKGTTPREIIVSNDQLPLKIIEEVSCEIIKGVGHILKGVGHILAASAKLASSHYPVNNVRRNDVYHQRNRLNGIKTINIQINMFSVIIDDENEICEEVYNDYRF